jgi:RimJ/RimL family protein N-acetyltransferase
MKDPIAETGRLRLRTFRDADAPMILELLNDPDWLRLHRRSQGAHPRRRARPTCASSTTPMRGTASASISSSAGPTASPLGMCGLVKRDTLRDPDLGFAFLARHRGAGYAEESARAALAHAANDLNLARSPPSPRPRTRAPRAFSKSSASRARAARPGTATKRTWSRSGE